MRNLSLGRKDLVIVILWPIATGDLQVGHRNIACIAVMCRIQAWLDQLQQAANVSTKA